MDKFKSGYIYARAMHTSIFCSLLYPCFFQEDGIFMARFLHQVSVSPKASRNHWILAFFWIVGLLTGILAVYLSGPSLSLLMRRTLDCSVSIARLLSAAFLPFILSALAVFLLARSLIFPIAFAKGFCVGYVSLGIVYTFGLSGLLFCYLLCFTDLLVLPLLWLFWLQCLNESKISVFGVFLTISVLVFLIGSIDYRLISPFLADLINL